MTTREQLSQKMKALNIELVLGTETHITLNTQTKLNCSCKNNDSTTPNTHVCETCAGQPGSMPHTNIAAVEKAIQIGKAINATIAPFLVFDRKHYEYPDLPSGFQRTQYAYPILSGGVIDSMDEHQTYSTNLQQIHLEEDAGKSIHDTSKNLSYVDYNRAGRPLIEVVTKPCIRSIPHLLSYLKQLQRLVIFLDISVGDLSKGYFKSDVSISLRQQGLSQLNPRTEIKNLNSFKAIEQASLKEIANQIEYREQNNAPKTRQVTVLFNTDTNQLKIMREKEDESDYRFLREANIPPISLSDLIQKHDHEQGLSPFIIEKKLTDAGLAFKDTTYFSGNQQRAAFLLSVDTVINDIATTAKVLMNALTDIQFTQIDPTTLAPLVKAYIDHDSFSQESLYEGIKQLGTQGFDIEAFIKQATSHETSSGELQQIIEKVIQENEEIIKQVHAGKQEKIGSLVGVVMKQLTVKLPGKVIKETLQKHLGFAQDNETQDSKPTKRKINKDHIDVNAHNIKHAHLATHYTTHRIPDISKEILEQTVTVGGWVQSIRDHGQLMFIDLRQDGEILQIKCSPEQLENFDILTKVEDETVI